VVVFSAMSWTVQAQSNTGSVAAVSSFNWYTLPPLTITAGEPSFMHFCTQLVVATLGEVWAAPQCTSRTVYLASIKDRTQNRTRHNVPGQPGVDNRSPS